MTENSADEKKKNIIITAVMIVLIAIIAIILVKINSSNVKNKEAKGIKPGTEAVKTKADTGLRMTALQTNRYRGICVIWC